MIHLSPPSVRKSVELMNGGESHADSKWKPVFKIEQHRPSTFNRWQRNFKCIYDPELESSTSNLKPIFRYDGISNGTSIEVIDPRTDQSITKNMTRHKRTVRNTLKVFNYKYDSNSFKPPTNSQIVISNLSLLTTKEQIALNFRSNGEIENLDLKVNPLTGTSLGVCTCKYKAADPDEAHKFAKEAVAERNGMKMGDKYIIVQLDENGLSDRMAKDLVAKAELEMEDLRKKQTNKFIPPPPRSYLSKSNTHISTINYSKPISTSLNLDSKHKVIEHLKGTPFLFIANKYCPVDYVTRDDLKKFFHRYRWSRIASNIDGFYIIFQQPEEALQCMQDTDGSKFGIYRIVMEYYGNNPTPKSTLR